MVGDDYFRRISELLRENVCEPLIRIGENVRRESYESIGNWRGRAVGP